MKIFSHKILAHRGSSLIETVIAVGVLAVAIPLVFGALAESGKSGMASEAETRSTWIVPICIDEIEASREGRPQLLTRTAVGQAFPSAGDVWALGFSSEGKPIGMVSKSTYDKGTKAIDGEPITYIASLSAENPPSDFDTTSFTDSTVTAQMLRVKISLEFPAAASAAKRHKLDFYTRIP